MEGGDGLIMMLNSDDEPSEDQVRHHHRRLSEMKWIESGSADNNEVEQETGE